MRWHGGGAIDRRGQVHLDQASQRLAIGGDIELVIGMHNAVALRPRQRILGQVQVDLIPIKVRIEGAAVGVVHADGALPLRASHPDSAMSHGSRCVP